MLRRSLFILFSVVKPGLSFLEVLPNGSSKAWMSSKSRSSLQSLQATASSSSTALYVPSEREAEYGSNFAHYLVDLHDSKATFNFCGGMMFQLVLSDKLRNYLGEIASTYPSSQDEQPIVHDAAQGRMFQIPNYTQSAFADNKRLFHGREVRQVPNASGGMGFVLHLSHTEDDPEGWTEEEVNGYDGWGHDSGRVWRKGDRLVEEGFVDFKKKFGPKAFALHHRFYLHYDERNNVWLSAEDGCEGTPSQGGVANRIAALMGLAS